MFVPCVNGGAGEVVDLSGAIHTLTTLTDDRNNTSGVTHIQTQGISGVGETTGIQYRVVGLTTTTFKFSKPSLNSQATETRIIRFDLIGQGPDNNFRIQETGHFTINANATMTVYFDNFIVECK